VCKIFYFVELIKEVRTNGPNLSKLLKTPINELEKNCINEALMIAVETGNHKNVGKLILHGASYIDEALEKSRLLQKYSVIATLLIVKAAMHDDDRILVLTLYGENVDGLVTKIPITERDNLSELQNCVLDQSFKTVVAIEIARRYNAFKVREELLLRTGIDKQEGTVLWFGLRLTQLEISWLMKVQWVKELMLARNEFSALPTEMGEYLKHCTKIDLRQNRLRKVPSSLLELPSLVTLNLSHNEIVEIPDVPQLPAPLSVLELSHNHLRSLPNFVAPKLETLDISFNQFHTVPDCVCTFLALTTLNIAYNTTILTLPNQLSQLKNLHDLNLEGLNDLHHPPKNYRATTDDCIRYLESQLRNAYEYLYMKLMVLGKHGVGKSTIVAKLLGKQISSESCSMVISKWKFTPCPSGKRIFNFRIWDFANQEGYDATYHCFLSKRSMYLLLWNVTEGDTGVFGLKPYLDCISTQVPGSCVIIVGTFLDMLSDEEQTEKVDYFLRKVRELIAQYQTLFVASINVVGLQNEAECVVKLKDDIYNAASEYKLNNQYVMGAMIPSSYHTLDIKLAGIYQRVKYKNHKPFMRAVEFRKLVWDSGLTDIQDDDYEEIHNVSQFLHEAGALLFYAGSKHNMQDLYVIDPCFLYDIMSAVFSVKQRASQGILTIKDLSSIVKNKGFPVNHFLALLIKFEIALPLDESCKMILVPSMLPKASPTALPDDRHYFRRFIYFSSPLSESYYAPSSLWRQLLSNVTNSVKEIMDVINELQITDKKYDIILSDDSSSEISSDDSSTGSSTGYFSSEIPLAISSSETYISSEEEIFCNSNSFQLKNLSGDESESLCVMTSDLYYSRERSIECNRPQLRVSTTPEVLSSNFPELKHSELLDEDKIRDLVYWQTGLLYNASGLCFVISSNENSKHKDKDGIMIMCSPTVGGRKVLCKLIELVSKLIDTCYPKLLNNLEQRVPCHMCIRDGVQEPYEFQVDQLLPLLDGHNLTTKCGANHKVHLRDLVPTNLDPGYLLDTNEVIISHLGAGISAICFTGKNSISNGCIAFCGSEPHELWICCDGVEGTELHIFKTNSVERINKHFLKMVQVCCVKQCASYIWVAAQFDTMDGIVFIFSRQSQELLFEIKTENIVVSCITNSDHTVYFGTEEGYCFAISMDIQFKYKDVWLHHHTKVSEYCIDGLVLTHTNMWLSSHNQLYILDPTSLELHHKGRMKSESEVYARKMVLSGSGDQVWIASLGSTMLSSWDAHQYTHLCDINIGIIAEDRCHISDPRDQIITAICSSVNTVWIGLVSGHIIVFDVNCPADFLADFKVYSSHICFLSAVNCHGSSQKCLILSGGKIFQPDDRFIELFLHNSEISQPMDISEVAILWEVKYVIHKRLRCTHNENWVL